MESIKLIIVIILGIIVTKVQTTVQHRSSIECTGIDFKSEVETVFNYDCSSLDLSFGDFKYFTDVIEFFINCISTLVI
jgi:hypothetical protein